jgi:hypothetical protein
VGMSLCEHIQKPVPMIFYLIYADPL